MLERAVVISASSNGYVYSVFAAILANFIQR